MNKARCEALLHGGLGSFVGAFIGTLECALGERARGQRTLESGQTRAGKHKLS
jgi:hypothetical protein